LLYALTQGAPLGVCGRVKSEVAFGVFLNPLFWNQAGFHIPPELAWRHLQAKVGLKVSRGHTSGFCFCFWFSFYGLLGTGTHQFFDTNKQAWI
jgi:hypothetical protein